MRPSAREGVRASSDASCDVETPARRVEGHRGRVEQRGERAGAFRTLLAQIRWHRHSGQLEGSAYVEWSTHVAVRQGFVRVAVGRNVVCTPCLRTTTTSLTVFHPAPVCYDHGCEYRRVSSSSIPTDWCRRRSVRPAPAVRQLALLLLPHPSRPVLPTRQRHPTLVLPPTLRRRLQSLLRPRQRSLAAPGCSHRWRPPPAPSLSARQLVTGFRTCSSGARRPHLLLQRPPLRLYSSSNSSKHLAATSRRRVSASTFPLAAYFGGRRYVSDRGLLGLTEVAGLRAGVLRVMAMSL